MKRYNETEVDYLLYTSQLLKKLKSMYISKRYVPFDIRRHNGTNLLKRRTHN